MVGGGGAALLAFTTQDRDFALYRTALMTGMRRGELLGLRWRDVDLRTEGLELVRDDSSIPGMRWVQVAPPGGGTQLTLVNWFESMPAGSLRGLVLRVTDLDETYDRLKARGVEFEGPPAQQPWAVEAVVHDPDGNPIVLQQA